MLNIPTTQDSTVEVLRSRIADNEDLITSWFESEDSILTVEDIVKANNRIKKYLAEIASRGNN